MAMAKPHCLRLLAHMVLTAFALAVANAGSSMAARMAIIAITTNNSINVNAAAFLTADRNSTVLLKKDVPGNPRLILDITSCAAFRQSLSGADRSADFSRLQSAAA